MNTSAGPEPDIYDPEIIAKFIRERMGSPRLPLALPTTIVYTGIFVTGVFGNTSVCMTIVKTKALHTTTNYYLFSLAVSDLCLLLLDEEFETY
ncbi:hypothetical protein GE061_000502 [Apolygus lucorum]|uniref:G-protein coupled receptors family 1 profile domain-containing protein n=1 Tax=Apolygus lucorum TaxID=248454 RepID=A0A8S9Y4S6_APOLU|nr:hypothetical protein GE061_000502 [Apolygus lucorum]